jgi:hypothetical protein
MCLSTSARALVASLVIAASAADARPGGMVEVPVTAKHSVQRKISSKLTLRVDRSEDVNGVASWEVGVDDGRWLTEGNILYHSPLWHGPYPTMVDPVLMRNRTIPRTNDLKVQGYPWRVSISCAGCVVSSGEHPRFVKGTIRVRWYRR